MLLTILICTGQSPKKDFLGPGVKSSTLASKFLFSKFLCKQSCAPPGGGRRLSLGCLQARGLWEEQPQLHTAFCVQV